jgi:hypothetical protein
MEHEMAHAAHGVRRGGSGTHDVMRVRLPAIRSRAATSRGQTLSEVGCALRQAIETRSSLSARSFSIGRPRGHV